MASEALGYLPVRAVMGELRDALGGPGRAVLAAPPGSGKTTGVPLALLGEAWLAGRSILLLEPRRLAARAAARRMADLLGEAVGGTVGYRVRLDHRVSARTRVEVVTEGILTRRLQDDPELEGVGLVVFDEFHERSLDSDLALALVLDVMGALRDDLRLLVMSATLDSARVAGLLGGAPVVTAGGRSHPVAVEYRPPADGAGIPDAVARGVREALAERDGDVLAFLPGAGEIRRCAEVLEEAAAARGVRVCPLFGDLPAAEQDAALRPDPAGGRRVVLATAIAETSLTIEGVSVVVDGGWSREPRFRPRSGLTGLVTTRVSRAAAEQRAGRAGRLGPGHCYRLWSESEHSRLEAHRAPEIEHADLASLVLELARWGVTEPRELAWLDPPPDASWRQARELLEDLDALDRDGRITPAGRAMAALPLHPRLAHMVASSAESERPLACDVSALLGERDILRGPGRDRPVALAPRLEALMAWRRDGQRGARAHGADPGACARVERAARQLRRLAQAADQDGADPEAAGALLALAYPDRVARRRAQDGTRYRLASGRGARLPEGDPLSLEPWLAVADLDAGAVEGRVYLAAPVDPEALARRQAHRVAESEVVAWDPQAQRVVQHRERRFGALVLARRPLDRAAPDAVRGALVEGLRRLGLAALPWSDAARALQARVESLRAWQPEAGWPDLSDDALTATLEDWLGPWLEGLTRRDQVNRVDLEGALRARLDWRRQQRLDAQAPTHLTVPSGARRPLAYTPGEPPVLAVKLQELFGLADTPTVGAGRVPVTLHLLSPAGRPVQVTRDLRGFWERTYPEVRKELKGRYPKHPWPDDPWTAVPTARAARRR